uniref:Glutamate-rich WD repeat-containing protein 1 n=1 Tax=Clastoptera arizonana TaxID=38151 RepID=A0A1B6BZV1_9HEMI
MNVEEEINLPEDVDMEGNNENAIGVGVSEENKRKVYLPGQKLEEGEELIHDPSAYVMFHEASTGAPCLSFDIIWDSLGNNRSTFPLTAYVVAGTQSDRMNGNRVIVMKLSNMNKTQVEDSDVEDDSDDEEKDTSNPIMETIKLKHHGAVNRIRAAVCNNAMLTAVWSEVGKVSILDVKSHLQTLDDPIELTLRKKNNKVGENIKPVFVFNGHQSEGYAMDWCPTVPGMLATGDCRRNIHVWTPDDSSWKVDQRPLIGHTDSVEDLQWSPSERHVLASASIDKTIRIWDTREVPTKACKLFITAHESDVNVISWNRNDPLIVSGGDDGFLHVWDLRQFKTGNSIATLKHHMEPVTTVEWHPTESSVFASGGADNQIALWDLAVERDTEADSEEIGVS